MGSGSWTTKSFANYTIATKSMSYDSFTSTAKLNVQDVYKNISISARLKPEGVMRECRDSEEHPNTIPIILGLDVTGSMGGAAVKCAQKLNEIMTNLLEDKEVGDVEFCIMGIGDLYCDYAPIQISQFESDIRIAEQMDEIYFEGGGGGNSYESYTSAWYMGLNHCDLDCWKRGQKGIIITLGDELLNPHLPIVGRWNGLCKATGDKHLQENIETKILYEEAKEKFDIYHISIDDYETSYRYYKNRNIDETWKELLGDNYRVANLNNLANVIVDIIKHRGSIDTNEYGVSW